VPRAWAAQIPRLEIELIDRPTEKPVGAGEAACCPVGPALANAVFDATGVRPREIPLTPERVKAALARNSALAPIAGSADGSNSDNCRLRATTRASPFWLACLPQQEGRRGASRRAQAALSEPGRTAHNASA
jgi:hypothetical protein